MSARVGRRAREVVAGGAAGIAAFVVGYLLTALLAIGSVTNIANGFMPLKRAGGATAPAWKLAGLAFYDAHFVGTIADGMHINLVTMASVEYLYLLVPFMLALAGGVVADIVDVDTAHAGGTAGMAVVLGYLPLTLVGTTIVSHANLGPNLPLAVVVMGGFYPFLFAGAGGAAVGTLASSTIDAEVEQTEPSQ